MQGVIVLSSGAALTYSKRALKSIGKYGNPVSFRNFDAVFLLPSRKQESIINSTVTLSPFSPSGVKQREGLTVEYSKIFFV